MTLAWLSYLLGSSPFVRESRIRLPIVILLCVEIALPAGVLRAEENHNAVRRWKVKESQDVPSKERRSLSLTPRTLEKETTDGVGGSIPFAGGPPFETVLIFRVADPS
jgi:hypothetical protein